MLGVRKIIVLIIIFLLFLEKHDCLHKNIKLFKKNADLKKKKTLGCCSALKYIDTFTSYIGDIGVDIYWHFHYTLLWFPLLSHWPDTHQTPKDIYVFCGLNMQQFFLVHGHIFKVTWHNFLFPKTDLRLNENIEMKGKGQPRSLHWSDKGAWIIYLDSAHPCIRIINASRIT